MNKKNIVLILILTIFLSVMVISVLGKAPEDKNRVDAQYMVIYDQSGEVVTDYDEESQNKDRIITIKALDTDKKDILYDFSVELFPIETTDDTIDYAVFSSDASMEEVFPDLKKSETDEEKKEVQRVHYYKMTFAYDQRVLTSIRFRFNKGGTVKFAYLRFVFQIRHEEDVGD